MIELNRSYLRAGKAETLVSVPSALPTEMEECIGSLLKLSQYVPLQFFVYISSEELKTANYYFELASPPWAEKAKKGKRPREGDSNAESEQLLISIILLNEKFSALMRFETVLQEMKDALAQVKDASNACYEKVMLGVPREVVLGIGTVERELTKVLKDFLPKVEKIVKDTVPVPSQRALIMEEDLQDEFVALAPSDPLPAATKKFAETPYALIGCVFESEQLVGIVPRAALGKRFPQKWTVADLMDRHFKVVDSNKPIHEVIDQLLQDRLLALPILANTKFRGVFSIFDALHHSQTLLDLLEQSPDLTPEQTRLLQLELWPVLRNVAANQKLLAREVAKEE